MWAERGWRGEVGRRKGGGAEGEKLGCGVAAYKIFPAVSCKVLGFCVLADAFVARNVFYMDKD